MNDPYLCKITANKLEKQVRKFQRIPFIFFFLNCHYVRKIIAPMDRNVNHVNHSNEFNLLRFMIQNHRKQNETKKKSAELPHFYHEE